LADDQYEEGVDGPTAAGAVVTPRDSSGTPTDHDERLTDEAEAAIETDIATGIASDNEGRPVETEPAPEPSDPKATS
jgi:hypothetical protein